MKPVISVVMAAYNVQRDLPRAIESILGQSYQDFELIIVDDASTDDSRRIALKYAEKDQRIRVFHNEKNIGAAGTRNQGLTQTKGRYIAILDADDVAHPNRLNKQVSFLELNPHIGLLGSTYRIIDEAGSSIAVERQSEKDFSIRWEMLLNNAFAHSSVMYRRELYLQVGGYSEDYTPSEDYDLFLRMSAITKMANLRESLTDYQRSPGGLSETQKEVQFNHATRVSHRAICQLMGDDFMSFEETKYLRKYLKTGEDIANKEKIIKKYLFMFNHFSEALNLSGNQKKQIRHQIDDSFLWVWWISENKFSSKGLNNLSRLWRKSPLPVTYRLIRIVGGSLKRRFMKFSGQRYEK